MKASYASNWLFALLDFFHHCLKFFIGQSLSIFLAEEGVKGTDERSLF